MAPARYSIRRGKVAGITLGSLAFVAVSLLLCLRWSGAWGSLPMVLAGVAGVLFFGLCALLGLRALLTPRAGVTLDDHGIGCHDWGRVTVPWEEIEDVSLFLYANVHYLGFELRDDEAFLRRLALFRRGLAKVNARFGLPHCVISLALLSVGPEELLTDVEARRARCVRFRRDAAR